MNIKDKNKKALANLMGWEDTHRYHAILRHDIWRVWGGREQKLAMYEANDIGLAQFAAILLKFPEVFEHFLYVFEPTQEGILDEILKIKDRWVE